MTTLWDELYRPQLATLHGCEKNDVASELFADQKTIRQDYVHNQGKATSKQAKNKRLKWFARGEQMIPTSANYEQLFHELVDELAFPAGAPTPIEKPNRGPVKARVPIDFVSQFEQTADSASLGPDAALEEALTQWIAARKEV